MSNSVIFHCAWCGQDHQITRKQYDNLEETGGGPVGMKYKSFPCPVFPGQESHKIVSLPSA